MTRKQFTHKLDRAHRALSLASVDLYQLYNDPLAQESNVKDIAAAGVMAEQTCQKVARFNREWEKK